MSEERLPNIHPGEVLREEFLAPLEMTVYRLAKETGLSQIHLHEIIKGKRSITAATALRLARYMGTTARFWMNLQASYDLEEAEQQLGDALARIRPREPAEEVAAAPQ
jgi:addiction module HigA family antidote